jgi:hypothetical protein
VTDGRQVVVAAAGSASAPLVSHDWTGRIGVTVDGPAVIVEYDATYTGARSFNAKEIGVTIHPAAQLTDLWWRRVGEWTTYPDGHVGRTAGYAVGAPGANGALRPAATWEEDATFAGSNDYRSAKRSILAAGMTDGDRSIGVLSDGSQHVRAELRDGLPVLHILDWYGGVRTVEGNHPIWSAYFGAGRAMSTGSRFRGRIVLVAGGLPEADQ